MSTGQNCIFPDDVIIQILARLPVKYLFRFKCVCKLWCRLPSEPYFVRLYDELSSSRIGVLLEIVQSSTMYPNFVYMDGLNDTGEFTSEFMGDRIKIRASCNGLLCCASVPNRGVYYVCNPMTRQWITLPRTRKRPVSRYHPDDESTLVGLAFDPPDQKFSVVLAGFYRPFGRRALDCLVCQVFDSATNLWTRSIFSHNDEFTHMNKNQAVYAYGALHWLTYRSSYVLALDLEKGTWRKVSLPDALLGSCNSRIYLLELEGSVSIIQITEGMMVIWLLKDYVNQIWMVADRISLRCVKAFMSSIFPISQSRDCVFLATQKHVLLYHRESKVWKELFSVKNTIAFPLWFSAHAYRRTLFSCHQSLDS
ncbi:F-box protein At5g49610 [Nymphaea colorata]|nr:F-box protein At5g49610 [Nymphaea colorata]